MNCDIFILVLFFCADLSCNTDKNFYTEICQNF